MPDYSLNWTKRSSAILAGQWPLRTQPAKRPRGEQGKKRGRKKPKFMQKKIAGFVKCLLCKIRSKRRLPVFKGGGGSLMYLKPLAVYYIIFFVRKWER